MFYTIEGVLFFLVVSLWPVSTVMKFESFLNSQYIKNIHNKSLLISREFMFIVSYMKSPGSKKVSRFLIRQFEKKTKKLSDPLFASGLWSGLYHLPLLLQSLGVKWRHLGSMRKCLFCIALSCPSTISSESVRMYWPWMQHNKVISHSLQHTAYIFSQWRQFLTCFNISTTINQNPSNSFFILYTSYNSFDFVTLKLKLDRNIFKFPSYRQSLIICNV